jgi:hypothetical protein
MTVQASVRAELNQTPAWWDAQYGALVRKCFPPKPFDPAEHEGHEIEELRTFGGTVIAFCAECPLPTVAR